MKALIKKYSHAWVLIYFIFYMTWFTWLEHVVTTKYTVIHLTLDDYIPFCEIFVIPPISFLKIAASFIELPHFYLSA